MSHQIKLMNTQDMWNTIKVFNPEATKDLVSFDDNKKLHFKGVAKVSVKGTLCEHV